MLAIQVVQDARREEVERVCAQRAGAQCRQGKASDCLDTQALAGPRDHPAAPRRFVGAQVIQELAQLSSLGVAKVITHHSLLGQ
jgi:hypothetical protein